MSLNIEIDDLKLDVINIYAPNIPVERENFFRYLNTKTRTVRSENAELLLGGDFNCTFDVKIDRRISTLTRTLELTDRGSRELTDLLSNYDLEDIWRRRNPNSRRYTYFKRNSKTASRIDFWLCTKSLDADILAASIKQSIKSDHNAIYIKLKTTPTERGPGFWKMSKNVLDSTLFDQLF